MPDEEKLPPRVEALMTNITRRLAPVCQDMPASEFTALVRRMAELEYKYERRGGESRDSRWP